MKILVVDDSITMRRIIINMLKSSGYEDVLEAGNGREGLSLMDSSISLVLTDWNMPVMDGLSFLKEIRSQPEYAAIPVIMVTTEGAQDEVLEALRVGASDYVVKPFNKTSFVKKIENFLPIN